MEKYKYRFFNRVQQMDETEAQTLDEAMDKIGLIKWKVERCYHYVAVILSPNGDFGMGVTWEKVE